MQFSWPSIPFSLRPQKSFPSVRVISPWPQRYFAIFLKQRAPALIAKLRAQTILNRLPSRRRQLELFSPRLRQGEQSLACIAPLARCNPLAPLHDRQRSRQRRRVQRQNLAQPPLRDLTRQRERLQDRELRSPQPQRPNRVVIELRERPRRPAEGGAQARQVRQIREALRWRVHTHIDAYTSIWFHANFSA